MKFLFIFKISLLLGVILVLSLRSQSSSTEKGSIEVLVSSDNSIYEQAVFGFQSVFDGEVRVSYLDIISSEYSDLSTYFRELEESGTQLIVAVGGLAAKASKENLRKIPIIFTMVNSPKTLGLESDSICGASLDLSMEQFFQTLKEINPSARRVLAFYSSPEGEILAGEGEYLDLKYKLIYQKQKVTNKDFESQLSEKLPLVDAFLMINDPIYNKSRFDTLSQMASKHKVILMTTFPGLVRSGATFGISPEYSNIGVETGYLANRILQQKSDCQREGVLLPTQSSFFLNEDYAKLSGVIIPSDIQERAKTTKLLTAGINLFNEGKYKSSKTVFENILKKDSKNTTANSYYQLALEKLSGSKTKQLMTLADEYYAKGNFPQARAEYQKVLAINPNFSPAKEGYKNSIQAQSEQERLKGNNQARNGNIFDAIRSYLASLRTLSTNTKTSQDLAQLRKTESSKIPDFLKQGIEEYKVRHYQNAIDIFENILLIDPSEKSAQEYLRSSYKKKEALQKLQESNNE